MKMKYEEVLIRQALLVNIGKKTLPRKASVAIARNISKLERECGIIDKQRKDIADRYAVKDEEGEFVTKAAAARNPATGKAQEEYTFAAPEDRTAFFAEVKELNETEVEIDVMKFRASELDRCEEAERYDILTPVQETALSWMIDYEDGDAKDE